MSYQRNGEFKRYRMAEADRPEHDPDVFVIFESKVEENVSMMKAYSERVDHSLETTIHDSDSRSAAAAVGEDSADIVITPPYGDHSTTVAYGQFSQDPGLLAGTVTYDEMRAVDMTGLGGTDTVVEPLSELAEYSPSLHATLETLREEDGRAEDTLNFFTDYYAVMEEVAKIVKLGQPVPWVVANRTMSRVSIPTHLITRELCEHLGHEFADNLPRDIPNKTLPWETAPGTKGDLMAEENIVVMRAPTA